MARGTAKRRQSRDTMSMQCKELAIVALWRSSIKSLEDNVAFYKVIEERLKNELAAAINISIRLSQLVGDIDAELLAIRERVSVKDGVIRPFVEDSRALLRPSFRSLVESFRAGLSKSVNEAFVRTLLVPISEQTLSLVKLLLSFWNSFYRAMVTV